MNPALAQFVRERARGLCEYCHMPEFYDRPGFEFEHVIARHDCTAMAILALTVEEAMDALRKAKQVGYRAPGA